ncbi:hypothetical protein CPZ06_10040 [Lactobacillus acidophilus]|nr:hypothetical protein CPZ06_10040 [Lactobacillus acidophilus]
MSPLIEDYHGGAAFDAVHLGLNVRIGELQGFDVEMTEVGEHLYGKLFDLPRVKIGEALSVLQIAAGVSVVARPVFNHRAFPLFAEAACRHWRLSFRVGNVR